MWCDDMDQRRRRGVQHLIRSGIQTDLGREGGRGGVGEREEDREEEEGTVGGRWWVGGWKR